MKKIARLGFAVLVFGAVALSASTAQSATVTLKDIAGPPPASLDQFFPPKAPAPVWLLEMFNLSGPFEGIGVNLQEQDMENAKASFKGFQAQYAKMAKMVPEWTARFPNAPVVALGKAIDSGKPDQIGRAMGGVGQVCGDCHLVFQVKVQQKYHWRNFDDIKVTEPVSQKKLAWSDFMTAFAGSFDGALVDLQEQKLDKARQNFAAFTDQYHAMATEGCVQCHVDRAGNAIPRHYYVDEGSAALVEQMGQALAADPPDVNAVMGLSGAVGMDICMNCHLVHMPAQTTKDIWSTYAKVIK